MCRCRVLQHDGHGVEETADGVEGVGQGGGVSGIAARQQHSQTTVKSVASPRRRRITATSALQPPTLFSSPPVLDCAQERASGLLELSKLWLFENCIGDAGACALAALFHSTLLEVHLSHNSVTNKGT